VEQRAVARVAEGGERAALVLARIGEEPERLIGVGGEDHAVEAPGLSVLGRQLDAARVAAHPSHRAPGVHAVAQPPRQRLHVSRAPPADRPPLRRVERQPAVMGEEPEQRPRGEAGDVAMGGRPHGPDQGQQEVPGERPREAVGGEELGERPVVAVGAVEQRARFPVEARDL
jgi:hypothetical protein